MLLLEYVFCGKPQNLSNGVFTYSSDSAGSFATLLCVRPFVVTLNPLYKCDVNGQWIGSGYCSKFYIIVVRNIAFVVSM